MRLRRLATPDAPAMEALRARLGADASLGPAGDGARWLLKRGHAWGLVDAEGNVDAFVTVRVGPERGLARVTCLTAESERTADRLLEHALAFARAQGAERVRGFGNALVEREAFARHDWPVLGTFAEMHRDGGPPTKRPSGNGWVARELPAATRDAEVARVVSAAFAPYRYRDPWHARDAARERRRNVCVGAFGPDGRLVGFAAITPPERERGSAYLGHVSVHPDAQGKRVGHALTTTVLDACAARGWGRQRLHVDVTNAPAVRLYERYGWEEQGRTPVYERAL